MWMATAYPNPEPPESILQKLAKNAKEQERKTKKC